MTTNQLLPAPASPPPANPSFAEQAWNLAGSIAAFVAAGCQTVSREEHTHRLQICDGCDRRRKNRCLECGCYISLKAQPRVSKCPLDKWSDPKQDFSLPLVP